MLKLGRRSFDDDALLIMAIVNRTPDSFYDRGATFEFDVALDRVRSVIADGAEIVDIGGVKAAPGTEVTAHEEIDRTVSFVAAVRAEFPSVVISVDTWRAEVGDAACPAGADVINDAWGGWDPDLAAVAAAHDAALVCTHAGGVEPRTRPHRVEYDDVMADVLERTVALAERAVALGVSPYVGADRPRSRLRQEHPALARGHPAAVGDGGDRLAGAGVAVEQGLRGRDARSPAGRAADRHAGDHLGVGLVGRACVPRAQRRRDAADARHGRVDPRNTPAGPHRPRPGLSPRAVIRRRGDARR